MLYRRGKSKIWWVMFRDPRRRGKFIRQSTGTECLKDARTVEETVHLAIKKQINEKRVKAILDSIYSSDRETAGLPLCQLWEVYERFITRRERIPGKQLINQRKKNLDDFIAWSRAKYPLVNETAQEVNFDCAMVYADYLRRKTKLRDKTRKEYIGNLSAIWNAAAAMHELKNPWKDVRPVVRDGKRHGAFTREQEAAVLAAARTCPAPCWYEACIIARWTGLRKHDVALLEWSAVDFEKGIIKTVPIKTQGYDIAVEIPMVEALRTALEALHAPGRKYVLPALAKAYPGDPGNYPFASVLRSAGVDDPSFTFHSWRHTFRTRLAEAGVPDELAKRLGGWTIDSTVRRYDHADKTEEIRRALESTSNTHQTKKEVL